MVASAWSASHPHLAQLFLSRHVVAAGKDVLGFSALAMQKLCSYDYPGNVRELENIVQRAIIAAPHTVVCPGAIRLAGEVDDCKSNSLLGECAGCPKSGEPAIQPAASPAAPVSRGEVRTDLPFQDAKELAVESFERQYVSTLLHQHGGNVSRAAAAMKLTRKSLARVMARHGLAGGLDGRGGKRGRPRRASG